MYFDSRPLGDWMQAMFSQEPLGTSLDSLHEWAALSRVCPPADNTATSRVCIIVSDNRGMFDAYIPLICVTLFCNTIKHSQELAK